MGIEQIVSKIIDEARDKASAIRADLDAKVDAVEKRWQDEEAMRRSEAKEALDSACERERDRLVTAEKLEARKRRLALRRELVDEAFKKARSAFLDLPTEKYRPLLTEMVLSAVISGEEEVILGSRDHSSIGEDVVAKANEILEKRGMKGKLRLAPEAGSHDAGAVLRHDAVECMRTLDELLLEVREKIEGRTASVLFEGEA